MNYNSVTVKKMLATTPLDASKLPANAAPEKAGAENESQYLVLVVDDSIDNLTTISLDLPQNGYRGNGYRWRASCEGRSHGESRPYPHGPGNAGSRWIGIN